MNIDHGHVVTTFTKMDTRGHHTAIVVFSDGCMISVIMSVSNLDAHGHTHASQRFDEKKTPAELRASGFIEDAEDLI